MGIFEKVECLLNGDLTSYKLGKENGLSPQYIDNYRTGKSKIENMQLGKALLLASYYNKIKGETTMGNESFIRLAKKVYDVRKEGYTSLVGYLNGGSAFVLNPEKNLFDEFQEFYWNKSEKDILEEMTDENLTEEELERVKEQATDEFKSLQEFKGLLIREVE